MELQKVEKIMCSEKLTIAQKNILVMLYASKIKGGRTNAKVLADELQMNYANVATNLRNATINGILAVNGIGGRAGKEYNINWELL